MSGRTLEAEFSALQLEVLGPSEAHLRICAKELARLRELAARAVVRRRRGDADEGGPSLARVYRELMDAPVDDNFALEDRPGKGAALNNQSIVLKLNMQGSPILLTGDQQFVEPEVPGLDAEMRTLRQRVAAAGPYEVVKVAHHGSYNGIDARLIRELGAATLFFTGGAEGTNHPSKKVLELLQANAVELLWARNDKNGRIDLSFGADGPEVEVARGALNDYTPNSGPDQPTPAVPRPTTLGPAAAANPANRASARDLEFTGTVRVPPDVKRIQITIEIEREGTSHSDALASAIVPPNTSRSRSSPSREVILPSGLPQSLLFVTHQTLLEKKVGDAAQRLRTAIRSAGHQHVDIGSTTTPWRMVQEELRRKSFDGVVLVGDYDVVPAARMDVIGPLRKELEPEEISNDSDEFIVWSDDVYGDIEGDQDPEVPVSRVPDCGNPAFLLSALHGHERPAEPLWGLRNAARPFADGVHAQRPAGSRLLQSVPFQPADVSRHNIQAGSLYFMLHGDDRDTSRFWGEDENRQEVEAFSLDAVPPRFRGSVFTGCCYGALIAQPAVQVKEGSPLRPLTPARSIALSFLSAGAQAFIGCTGTHYSPNEAPFDFFGGPLHRAFFESYDQGVAPARALLMAKQAFGRGFPHGMQSPAGQAIELKILRTFTCLGLGW